ncbi:MAG: hypothetical protein ACRCZB_09790 [Bacteroidales bacterium]
MSASAIKKAASIEHFEHLMSSFANTGNIANKLASFIRKQGFGAHASPAYNGVAHYGALAELAGMGVQGRNGMLISPIVGSRQRLAVIFTSIENPPSTLNSEHLWVLDFCKKNVASALRAVHQMLFIQQWSLLKMEPINI